jgi:photosystem II stability/assembly factor-like uncharacterized protein
MTDNGGEDWSQISDRISISQPVKAAEWISMRDATGDTITIATIAADVTTISRGIYHTTDGGLTWTSIWPTQLGGATSAALSLRQDPNSWICVGSNDVGTSTDCGETWIIHNLGYNSIKSTLYQDPTNDSTLFFTDSYYYNSILDSSCGGVMRSDDLGQSWIALIDFFELFGSTRVSVKDIVRFPNGDLLVSVGSESPSAWQDGQLLISRDDGATWSRILDQLPPHFRPISLLADEFAHGTAFVIGSYEYGVYRTQDYGSTWSRCSIGSPSDPIKGNDLGQNRYDGRITASILDAGLFVSDDHGNSWELAPLPAIGCQSQLSAADSSIFLSYSYSKKQWTLEPYAQSWREMFLPDVPDTICIGEPILSKHDSNMLMAVRKYPIGTSSDSNLLQLAVSSDNGQNWSFEENTPFYTPHRLSFHKNDWQFRICLD